MRHPGVEPGLQEPESCVRSITLATHHNINNYIVNQGKRQGEIINFSQDFLFDQF